MKATRHIIITTLITLCAFGSVLYTSCKNKCGSTTCQNGGVCENNICACPTGYSGNACQTGWADPVVGTYKCTRSNCKPAVTGVNSWVTSITKDATNSGFTIDITNFDNSNTTIVAIVDSAIAGVTKITVSPAVGSGGINASGTYLNGTITLSFTTAALTGGASYSCNMSLIKE